MTPEHVLVPYQCSPLPPGPWLIFAPHADDETFGMGGSLYQASRQGVTTTVVVMTDGALGGNADNLVARRQSEVQAAARLLGVSALHLWDFPDRGLSDDSIRQAAVDKVAACIADCQPGTVFMPGLLEPHPDHRGTTAIVWAALQQLTERPWRGIQPACWLYEISVQSPVNRLIDITTVMDVKQQAMDIYASQNSENNYPDLIRALNKARTFSMPSDISHVEAYFEVPADQSGKDLQYICQTAIRPYFEAVETKG